MVVFVALAEAKNFRAAGERLGVTASAVSQTLRRLGARLGAVLAHRTTRSVRLTEAAERRYAAVRPALDEVRAAAAAVGELGAAAPGGEPRGTLRLHVAAVAESFLEGPVLDGFLAAHPHVRLDVYVSNEPVDVVAAGYDAGLRLGEVIDRDMIAVPVSGDVRLAVVGAPAYLARRPAPAHPRDLADHECLNWHASADAPPYRWEFTEPEQAAGGGGGGRSGRRDFSVSVPARVLTNDAALLLRLARAGRGLAMLYESQVRDDLARGALVAVLERTRRRSRASTSTTPSGGARRPPSARWLTTCSAHAGVGPRRQPVTSRRPDHSCSVPRSGWSGRE